MRRPTILLTLLTVCQITFGQTKISERVELGQSDQINLDFAYCNEINIRGWDENYASIEAKVLINMGKNDQAYTIDVATTENGNKIKGYIKDKDKLPQMIQIKKGDQMYYFDTEDWNDPKIKNFYEEHGREGIEWMSHGVAWEISLEIKVPRNANLEVSSKHGIIDIEDFTGIVRANSKHGGVDIAVPASSGNKFSLLTQWGEIYTNLDFKYDKKSFSKKSNDWNKVECTLGNGDGALIALESKHGNLYLRKEQ